jgi:hypothetical protein
LVTEEKSGEQKDMLWTHGGHYGQLADRMASLHRAIKQLETRYNRLAAEVKKEAIRALIAELALGRQVTSMTFVGGCGGRHSDYAVVTLNGNCRKAGPHIAEGLTDKLGPSVGTFLAVKRTEKLSKPGGLQLTARMRRAYKECVKVTLTSNPLNDWPKKLAVSLLTPGTKKGVFSLLYKDGGAANGESVAYSPLLSINPVNKGKRGRK